MSNVKQIKKENIRSIIQVVRNSDTFTKPEIAQETGLTGATVHGIVQELEKRGLLKKCGFSSSNGGRKAQLFSINNDYRYFVGIALRTNKIVLGIFDFCMNLLCTKTHSWDLANYSVIETIYAMGGFLEELVKEYAVDRGKIIAVGVNAPGPVDYVTGKILSLRGYSKWHNINLSEELERLLGIRVLVEKDVNSGILFLKQLEKASNQANMIYLSVEEGIGAGVMINGELYRGKHGVAGEIGHTTVQENGMKCNCGNVGCLELVSSDFAIIKKAKEALHLKESDAFSLEKAIDLAKEGEPMIQQIFQEAVKYLAITIRNCFMIYDPDEIFIRCKWIELYETSFFQMIDELYDGNTLIDRGNTRISFVNEEKFVLRSAATVARNYELEFLESDIYSS